MSSHSKSTAANGSLSQATRGVGESNRSVESVEPFVRNDLGHLGTSTFDSLQVFLARCRSSPGSGEKNLRTVPPTPIVPPGFTDPSKDGSPDSVKTGKPEPPPYATPIIPSQPHPNPTPYVDDEELLQICLDAVLPICNESRFRELPGEFRDASGHERSRYGLFVELFNFALQRLSEPSIPRLRARSDSNILLHVGDPKQITGYHSSIPVPDINIVSLAAAKRANPTTAENRTEWVDFALSCAKGEPGRAFSWPEVLGAFEFKREKNIKTDTPKEYTNSSPVPLPHHRLDVLDLASVSGAGDASQSTSTRSTSTRSGLSESGPAASHASCLDTCTDAKAPEFKGPGYRNHDLVQSPLPGSHEPKRRRHILDPEDLGERSTRKQAQQEAPSNQMLKEAMVQWAAYASEMLSGSISRTHAINLLVMKLHGCGGTIGNA